MKLPPHVLKACSLADVNIKGSGSHVRKEVGPWGSITKRADLSFGTLLSSRLCL